MLRLLLPTLSLSALLGCGSPVAPPATAPSPGLETRTPEPPLPAGTIEPAYTAAEIAHSHPIGTFTEYRIQQTGAPTVIQRTLWVDANAEGCQMTATTRTEAGGENQVAASGAEWWELRNHGALPAEGTTVSEESIQTPAGRFECLLYTYAVELNGTRQVMRLWFDRASAGSPVRMTREVDGETVTSMELLATNRRRLPEG